MTTYKIYCQTNLDKKRRKIEIYEIESELDLEIALHEERIKASRTSIIIGIINVSEAIFGNMERHDYRR